VKTITPDKTNSVVQVKSAGNFNKLIVVKITDNFQFGARMIARKSLEECEDKLKITWDSIVAGEADQETHRRFPFARVSPKGKVA
jgi:hypothetical protein